jgi:hypothetical protein
MMGAGAGRLEGRKESGKKGVGTKTERRFFEKFSLSLCKSLGINNIGAIETEKGDFCLICAI